MSASKFVNIPEFPIPPLTWTDLPTLQNSWTVYAGTNNAQYTKDALGYVQLRGELQSHASTGLATDTLLFTLPLGFRPLIRAYAPFHENGNALRHVYISSDGTVKLATGVVGSSVFNLNAIRFPTS